MSFDFNEAHYIYAMAFISCKGRKGEEHGSDITFCLYRKKEEPLEWTLQYRHRYYAEENNSPWDDKDRKSWYRGSIHGTEAEIGEKLVSSLPMLAKEILNHFGGQVTVQDVLMVQGDLQKFIQEVERQKKPWMHIKIAKGPHG